MNNNRKDRWVFAYGSLMWRPGFEYEEGQTARLHGYHRALCVFSPNYRGTHEKPGLVVGLDAGGSCIGRAFRLHRDNEKQVQAYLDERELLTGVYNCRDITLALETGSQVPAYGYVVKRSHELYTGKLTPIEASQFILGRAGRTGTCLEYLENTVTHIEELGIDGGDLRRVLDLVQDKDAG
ncbi:MAG: gamma-glutamylcyclotransferase [Rhodospirillales bacterium]|nr:gamma-glutamylcyclotransferase [Rhodospirillales bacterium]